MSDRSSEATPAPLQHPTAERILAGGGEMGALMRSMDWSRTPLGPVEGWSAALCTSVSMILASPYPMAVYWGPGLVLLYNDSFRPLIGNKHPEALGASAQQTLVEAWDTLSPLFAQGQATRRGIYTEDGLVCLERQGFLEECYFSWSFVPTCDERGHAVGFVNVVNETTRQVLGARRFKIIRELSIRAASAQDVAGVQHSTGEVLAQDSADVPFALLYTVKGEQARLAFHTGLEAGAPMAPRELPLSAEAASPWPLAGVLDSGREWLLEDLAARGERLHAGPWPEPPGRALLTPLSLSAGGRPDAVLITGLSPRLPLDKDYRDFLQLLARQVSADVVRVRALEEEKQRAARLTELDQAKTAFFSNVSHEFRTPLTLMLGPLEDALAEGAEPLSPAQRERLSLVQRSGQRLFKLVNSLLDFSRLEAGRARVAYHPVDLAAVSAELASHFESAARRAGLVLTVDVAPLSQPAWVDRDAWEKILFNLLSNALKYTFEGGITVSLREEEGQAVLRVRDTGTGIPAEALPHVFERFHRVEGARARSNEGSGIGLSLVRELTRLHGGRVSVHSQPGEGSTFSVHLPLGSAHLPREQLHAPGPPEASEAHAAPYVDEALGWMDRAPLAASPSAPPASASPPARVLVVDDNADMRAYLTGLLAASFEVRAVEDGEQALALARTWTPELIVSDVMMPRLGGFGLLREVRARPELRAIPFLLLSARAGEEASVEGLEAGADDYLVKPFSARELLARVQAHLALSRTRHALAAHEAREASLEEAVHARDDFLSVASHELKTPLAALRLQLETLERTLPAEVRSGVSERLFAVRRQAQRLGGLVETMLDVSLVAMGQLQLKREPEDLAVLVADNVAQMREELARHGCVLTLESEPGLHGHLDAPRVGQLVRNLLSNAARHGAGQPVGVRLRRHGALARLEVADHGPGVRPEQRSRLFQRFERAVPARSSGGLGLGLWVSRQVVEAHGGTIGVLDTPGGGATFCVELPLQPSSPA